MSSKFWYKNISLLLFQMSIYLTVVLPIWMFNHQPKPYLLKLPAFKGRIFSAYKINTGIFTVVKEEFESISQWGDEAILIYEKDDMRSFPAIKLRAWRPDRKTTGLIQYAEKSFNHGWELFYITGEIQKKENYLKIFPKFNGGSVAISCLFGIISFAFSYMIYLAFKLD